MPKFMTSFRVVQHGECIATLDVNTHVRIEDMVRALAHQLLGWGGGGREMAQTVGSVYTYYHFGINDRAYITVNVQEIKPNEQPGAMDPQPQ